MAERFTFAARDRSEKPRTHSASGINKSSVSIRAVFSALPSGCMVIARKDYRERRIIAIASPRAHFPYK